MGKCTYCESTNTFQINTYKHLWTLCQDCGTAIRKLKDKFIFSFIPIRQLKVNEELFSDVSKIYDDHYLNEKKMIADRRAADKFHKKYFIDRNMLIEGLNILDISGGAGHFINEFQKYGASVALTEFNKVSVDFARERYNINAHRFDFNTNSINQIFNEKFDIVLLRCAYGFCIDVDKFLKDLKNILNKDALVIWTHNYQPSIGFFLRWQIPSYIQLILHQPEITIKLHQDNGYVLEKLEQISFFYRYNYGLIKNLGAKFLALLYYFPTVLRIPPNRFNFRDRRCTCSHLIFKSI